MDALLLHDALSGLPAPQTSRSSAATSVGPPTLQAPKVSATPAGRTAACAAPRQLVPRPTEFILWFRAVHFALIFRLTLLSGPSALEFFLSPIPIVCRHVCGENLSIALRTPGHRIYERFLSGHVGYRCKLRRRAALRNFFGVDYDSSCVSPLP